MQPSETQSRGQPLTVHLPQHLSKEGRWCLQQTKLPIAELYCCPGDGLVTFALLSEQFRCVSVLAKSRGGAGE